MKYGVVTESLKQPLDKAFKTANELGVTGVQIYATYGAFSPDQITENDKKLYKQLLKDNGLEVTALCADMGGAGFEIDADNAQRIDVTKRIADLAAEFGAKAITSHIGVIPDDKRHPTYDIMLRALSKCGEHAKSVGVTMAIETGPEKARTLLRFLKDTNGGVGVNLDPANFTMVTAQDAADAVHILKDYIVHTHLKDGVKLSYEFTPEEIYHGEHKKKTSEKVYREMPIGSGDVNWDEYVTALMDIGYDGYLTIEREAGEQPLDDIRGAVKFIKEKVSFLESIRSK